ncbi:MAG: right-handed parallel beta-helix repeat-containing protein [Sedimentisphaerales bacterium]|nr:right-handed parallel beta-helix repeat-containing protein [Sedimentisphaerales bacterium]
MKAPRVIVLAVTSALAVGSCAWGKDVFVLAGASGDGTKDGPYGMLWKAVEKATRGDVIHVAEGTYEGKGGCGAFLVKVPKLTIVGGYKKDFTERSPFKYLTILQRAKDYKGDWTGLPEGIVHGDEQSDHSGLVLDGLVLDAQTRNAYDVTGKVMPQKSFQACLVKVFGKDIKIRNCTLLNPYGEGIYGRWQGRDNEISNCFILNTFREGISTRSAQDGSKIVIRNCTIAFCWFQPGKGGGIGVFVGGQGATTIQDCVIAYMQTEGGEEGNAVNNTFGNSDTVLKGNVFFQCQGGHYKYQDTSKKNLLVWKSDELKDLNKDAESYMLSEAGDNVEADPGLKPDKEYFGKFASFVASEPGKLNMDTLNSVRQALGLSLQAERGTARENWGMAYPRAAVVPNMVCSTKGKGVQPDAPLEKYQSAAQAESPKSYAEMEFDAFKKGVDGVKDLAGKATSFKAQMGPSATSFLLKDAPQSDYVCYKLEKPGDSSGATRNCVFGYLQKGSDAHKNWEKLYAKKDTYNKQGGIVVKGTAWYLGTETYPYPVGIIVAEVNKP